MATGDRQPAVDATATSALWETMGRPQKILAPMVDASELAFRTLTRRHGADLCVTPMFSAKKFASEPAYREAHGFGEGSLDGSAEDRPL